MPSKNSSSAKMMDSDEFRDKLKNMGKTSKKKFAQMAAMFSRRKNSAKHFLGHAAGAPSKDNLLLHAEPLVNEEDSDTEDSFENPNAKNSGFDSRHHHNPRDQDDSGAPGGGSGSKQKTPTKGKYTSFS